MLQPVQWSTPKTNTPGSNFGLETVNKEPLWRYATDEIHYFYYYCHDNKPLTCQVRGAHCEVQTEFFLLVFSILWPGHKVRWP